MRPTTPTQTRFRSGSPTTQVNPATHPNSQAHSSKGTPSPTTQADSDGLTAHGFRNSFTPLPGYFSPFPHGTLHYRSPGSISTYQVVLADSRGIPRVPRYSGTRPTHRTTFAYGSITHSARAFQHVQLAIQHARQVGRPNRTLPQPRTRNTCRLRHASGLVSSRFARHYSGNRYCFLFL